MNTNLTNRRQIERHPSLLGYGRGANRWSSESSVNSFRHYRVVTEEDKVKEEDEVNFTNKGTSKIERLTTLLKWLFAILCATIVLTIILRLRMRKAL